MKEITSVNNEKIKNVRLLMKRKYRKEHQQYVIEGFHLVEEALKNNAKILQIFYTAKGKSILKMQIEVPLTIEEFLVPDHVIKSLSELPTSQGILAVVEMEEKVFTFPVEKPILLLDKVQDPGNVGTMIRTADAAGFSTVILGEGCTDIYSGKVLRSMQGSHFHLELFQKDLKELVPLLKKEKILVYGTALDDQALSYEKVEKKEIFALIMGNEGNGMDPKLAQLTSKNLYIPMAGKAESLNVAIAAGILMFALKK